MKVHKKFACAAFCLSLSSFADATTYIFKTGDLLDDREIGTLTIVNGAEGTEWTLHATWDILASPNAYIHSLTYDYAGTASLSPLSNWAVPTGNVGLKMVDNNGIYFETKNNSDMRFISPESVSWVFKGTTTAEFSNFIAHVNAVTSSGAHYPAVVSPVPEPGMLAMLISGLGVISLTTRRKRVSHI